MDRIGVELFLESCPIGGMLILPSVSSIPITASPKLLSLFTTMPGKTEKQKLPRIHSFFAHDS